MPLLGIRYEWNRDNTVALRTEDAAETAIVSFEYDRRQRLIGEERHIVGGADVYDITYTYDPLGDRLERIDDEGGWKTAYYYDSDPANRDPDYPTNNNRLLWYEEYESDGQGGWQATPARVVRYTYYVTGHVSNITIKDEYPGVGDPADYEWYNDLALYYTSADQLWRVLWDRWKADGEGDITDWAYLPDHPAREFYYEGAGQRFLTRDIEPGTWEALNPQHWTDTMGLLPYGDFDVTVTEDPPGEYTADVDEAMRYLSAAGLHAQQTLDGDTDPIRYLHGDLIDSTMLTTDEQAAAAQDVSYTAFGEPVGDPAALASRYQYAGGWGYESDLLWLSGANPELPAITLQHVGARWYQPSIGRFIMRDPIGLGGGPNTYTYVVDDPLTGVDPLGLLSVPPPPPKPGFSGIDWSKTIVGGAAGGAAAGAKTGTWVGVGIGAGVGAAGGALGYPAWWSGTCMFFDAWDILHELGELAEAEANMRRQRQGYPKIYPPKPRREVEVPPCMTHVI